MDKKHGLAGKPSNNAGKTKLVKRTANLNIKCYDDQLANWKDAATKSGTDLSKFVCSTLDDKAKTIK